MSRYIWDETLGASTHIPITAKAFSDALTERGIAHQFEMYNGDHRNRLWGPRGRLYTELLPYFSRLLERDGEGARDRSR